jgi:hypothetical protein
MNTKQKELISLFLNNSIILCSWGISNINIDSNIVSFSVYGFKYKGSIQIQSLSNYYKVTYNNRILLCKTPMIVIKQLDEIIEHTDTEYSNDIIKWIKSLH